MELVSVRIVIKKLIGRVKRGYRNIEYFHFADGAMAAARFDHYGHARFDIKYLSVQLNFPTPF